MQTNKLCFVLVSLLIFGFFPFYTKAAQSTIGTNILYNGTVYTIATEQGKTVKRPYTSAAAYRSYKFNTWENITTASAEDLNLPTGSFIPPREGSIFCSDRAPDQGTCYLITNNKKAGFTSEQVFNSLGYTFTWALYGDSSFLNSDNHIDSSSSSHPPGTLVNKDGTIYLVTKEGIKGVPSLERLYEWGYWVEDAIAANSYDRNLTAVGILDSRPKGEFLPYTTTPPTETNTLTFSSDSMPDGTAGKDYSYTFKVTGGTAPYTFENYYTTHPCCYVGIMPSTGVFSNSGTNMQPLAGNWEIGIKVTDSKGLSVQKIFKWKVVAAESTDSTLSFITSEFADGKVGEVYSKFIGFSYKGGGNLNASYTSLPPGFSGITIMNDSYSSSSKQIYLTGLPIQVGSYSFDVNFVGSLGYQKKKTFSITIKPAETTETGPPQGTTNNGYTVTTTSPNGGETWTVGSTKTITWTSSTQTGSATISLVDNLGTAEYIAFSIPNTGSYQWTVEKFNNPPAEPTQFKISVGVSGEDGNSIDYSDNYFTIP